jgi:hypothetical protein
MDNRDVLEKSFQTIRYFLFIPSQNEEVVYYGCVLWKKQALMDNGDM